MITLDDVLNTLNQGWATYVDDFKKLSPDAQSKFLASTGFDSFHDLLGHVIGWWEEGMFIINGILDEPGFTWKERDTDAFNHELTEKYSAWSDEDLLIHYENVRQAMIDLVILLPVSALENKDIYGWLEADVIEHLADHKIG